MASELGVEAWNVLLLSARMGGDKIPSSANFEGLGMKPNQGTVRHGRTTHHLPGRRHQEFVSAAATHRVFVTVGPDLSERSRRADTC